LAKTSEEKGYSSTTGRMRSESGGPTLLFSSSLALSLFTFPKKRSGKKKGKSKKERNKQTPFIVRKGRGIEIEIGRRRGTLNSCYL
jgi:hypothetical protein